MGGVTKGAGANYDLKEPYTKGAGANCDLKEPYTNRKTKLT
jgi:hypothetical protein